MNLVADVYSYFCSVAACYSSFLVPFCYVTAVSLHAVADTVVSSRFAVSLQCLCILLPLVVPVLLCLSNVASCCCCYLFQFFCASAVSLHLVSVCRPRFAVPLQSCCIWLLLYVSVLQCKSHVTEVSLCSVAAGRPHFVVSPQCRCMLLLLSFVPALQSHCSVGVCGCCYMFPFCCVNDVSLHFVFVGRPQFAVTLKFH